MEDSFAIGVRPRQVWHYRWETELNSALADISEGIGAVSAIQELLGENRTTNLSVDASVAGHVAPHPCWGGEAPQYETALGPGGRPDLLRLTAEGATRQTRFRQSEWGGREWSKASDGWNTTRRVSVWMVHGSTQGRPVWSGVLGHI